MLCLGAGVGRAQSPAPPPRQQDTPPDPRQGEPYDGRPRDPPVVTNDLLVVPRVLLAPPRLLFRGLAWTANKMLEYEERTRLGRRVAAAFTSEDGLIGLRPVFQWQSGFLLSGGAYFFHDRLLGPGTAFNATLTLGGDDLVFAQVYARPVSLLRRGWAAVEVTFDRRPDRLFTGVAVDRPSRGFARYGSDQLDVLGIGRVRLTRRLELRLVGGFGLRRFFNGREMDEERPIDTVYCQLSPGGVCLPGRVDEFLVPGWNEGTQFVRVGADLHLDTRDHPIVSSAGLLLDGGFDYTEGLGDGSRYFRLHAKIAVPINLWARNRVLVFRAASSVVANLGDVYVPFSELPTLGGRDFLPGFRIDRFRGASTFVVSAEYRWPIWMWMDGMLFGGYGGAFGTWFEGFGASQMRGDLGAGIRLRTHSRFYVRIQFAYGFFEGPRVFISGTPTP